MAKFEIGQRVRITEKADCRARIGDQAGVVVALLGDKEPLFCVDFDASFAGGHDGGNQGQEGHCRWLRADEIATEGSAAKGAFKIGDKVFVIDIDADHFAEVGIVEHVDSSPVPYLVTFADESWSWLSADAIRLATSYEIEEAEDDPEDPDDDPQDDTRIEISVTVKIPPSVLMDFLR